MKEKAMFRVAPLFMILLLSSNFAGAQGSASTWKMLMEQHRFDQAASIILQLLEEEPAAQEDLTYHLGICYHRLGMTPQAKEIWQSLADRGEYQALANLHLGSIYLTEGNLQPAILHLGTVTALEPDNAYYLKLNARAMESAGLDSFAVVYYKSALDKRSQDLEAIYELAALYYKMEDYHAAGELLYRGLILNRAHHKIRELEIETCYSDRYYSHTLSLVQQWQQELPMSNYLRRIMAVSFVQTEAFEKALETLNTIEDPDKNEEITFFTRYRAYNGLKDWTQARLWLEKALEASRSKNEGKYYGLLANVFIELEMYNIAAKRYMDAFERTDDKQLAYWAARSYDAAGQMDLAKLHYKRFIDMTSNDVTYFQHEFVIFSRERVKKLTDLNY